MLSFRDDALSRLKTRLETEAVETSSTEEENETTDVFALTFVELEDDLSRSISEGISQDPRMETIRQALKDSAQDLFRNELQSVVYPMSWTLLQIDSIISTLLTHARDL